MLTQSRAPGMLSACPISHNSIHLFIITTDFVVLYLFTGYVGFIITSFLPVLSLKTNVCSILMFYPVFLRS